MSAPGYQSYRDSGIEWLGLVPSHWSTLKLSRLVDPRRAITYGIVQAGPDIEGGVPYIRPADMTDESGVRNHSGLLRTSGEIATAYRRSTVHTGDIVCSIGPSFGKVMIVPSALDGANLTQGTARIAVRSDACARYVFWTLRSRLSISQWESGVGGATFGALNLEPLARTLLCCPPLPEQIAIAAFLDRETGKIDALVEAQRRLIKLLKEKRQAVISHSVTRGLDPTAPTKDSGVEWLGAVPAHWEISRLARFADRVVVGIAEAAVHAYAPTGVPILRSMNVRRGRLVGDLLYVLPEYAAERGTKMIRAGDILTVRTGHAGVSVVIPPELDGCQCFTMLVTTPGTKMHADYACEYLNSAPAIFYFGIEAWGAAQPNISVPILKDIPMPLPPLAEQEQIQALVKNISVKTDTLMAEAEAAIILLRERRSALISAAVTGKIDVRGLVPEWAEAA